MLGKRHAEAFQQQKEELAGTTRSKFLRVLEFSSILFDSGPVQDRLRLHVTDTGERLEGWCDNRRRDIALPTTTTLLETREPWVASAVLVQMPLATPEQPPVTSIEIIVEIARRKG